MRGTVLAKTTSEALARYSNALFMGALVWLVANAFTEPPSIWWLYLTALGVAFQNGDDK